MDNAERIVRMREKLEAALQPQHLEIVDDSHLHAGHAGAASGAGHFTVHISSPQFEGKRTLACHRLVYAALDDMMITDIHALSIKIP